MTPVSTSIPESKTVHMIKLRPLLLILGVSLLVTVPGQARDVEDETRTRPTIRVELVSGDVLTGTLAAEADGSVVLIADEGGERIPVAMSTVGEINPSATRWSGDVASGGILGHAQGNA